MSKIYIPRVEEVADIFGIGEITQDAWQLGSFPNWQDAVACKFDVIAVVRAGLHKIASGNYHCFSVEVREDDSIIDVIDIIPNVERFIEAAQAEYTTAEQILQIVDNFRIYNGTSVWDLFKGRMFFAHDEDTGYWVACDNTTGDCFIEEFQTMFDCLNYLYGVIDSEGNLN